MNNGDSAPKGDFNRVFLIVLDGVGAGELPDAQLYGDHGANTLGNLSRAFKAKTGRTMRLPTMESWGLGSITLMEGLEPSQNGTGAFGKLLEQSRGKDTSSGHWEMAGLIVAKPFVTFPEGFPRDVVEQWIRENQLPGVLGNKAASGTEIIDELGREHLRTGKPILYTSADSVWQVAAHEDVFGLDRLYSICKSARKICDELQIGRVIARPFIGNPDQGQPFKRTYNRKDYSQLPPCPTYLNVLQDAGIDTLGIGKISAIYAGQGIANNIDTKGNADSIRVMLELAKTKKDGLIFANLIDFDMLFGHRRDVEGFGKSLEEFDRGLSALKSQLGPKDLVILTSDHGNDPTFHGTDHTREYALLLAHSPAQKSTRPLDIGIRGTFADLGATVTEALLGKRTPGFALAGQSFLGELLAKT